MAWRIFCLFVSAWPKFRNGSPARNACTPGRNHAGNSSWNKRTQFHANIRYYKACRFVLRAGRSCDSLEVNVKFHVAKIVVKNMNHLVVGDAGQSALHLCRLVIIGCPDLCDK